MTAAASMLRILLVALLSVGATGLKLRVYDKECMTKQVSRPWNHSSS